MTRLLHKIKKNFDVIYCRGLGDGAISICLLKAIGEVRLPMVACPINAKGIDVLLKALSNVVAAGREFSLELIGNGPDMALLLEQRRRLCLEKQVFFTRALAKDTIRPKLAYADVFLLPSRYEGMSNATLEAMEAGLPILLTRCGGIDTYIDESTGWTCEPDDVHGLTDALLRMLDTPGDKLLEMGKQVRLLVACNFQIETIGRQNEILLGQLVKASRP